jgi:hypothetical protein
LAWLGLARHGSARQGKVGFKRRFMKPSVKEVPPIGLHEFSKRLLGKTLTPREVFTVRNEQKLMNWEFSPKT